MTNGEFFIPHIKNTGTDEWIPFDAAAINNGIERVDVDRIKEIDLQVKVVSEGLNQRFLNVLNHAFGAYGDGESHPLSAQFKTLEEAREVYPHATSLNDEVDWCAIQKAINYVELRATLKVYSSTLRLMYNTEGLKEVYLPSGIYLLGTKTLSINVSTTSLIGNGSFLDCRNTNLGIRLYGGDHVGRIQNFTTLKDINLFGNRGSGSTAILLRGESSDRSVQWINCENINIQHFGTALKFERNAHQINFFNFTSSRCEINIHVANESNMGERLTFIGGTISDSTLNIFMECMNGSIKLTNVSIDYSDQYIKVTGGRVSLANCHIEGSSDVAHGIEVYGNASAVQLNQTEILPGRRNQHAFGYSDESVNFGGLSITDCHIFGGAYNVNTLISGKGRVVAKNVARFRSDRRFIIAPYLNMFGNGNFKRNIGLGDFTFTSNDQPILDIVEFDTEDASLVFATTANPFCEARTINYPLLPGHIMNYSLKYKSIGIASGRDEFKITYQFKNEANHILSSGTKTISIHSEDWIYTNEGALITPVGSTKVSFIFITSRWGANSSSRFWIDEFILNIQ
ncbi:hypothetical protein [Alkalicoccobacillus porphyridii]|uniref:Uncharacterized protein n=1 Tax=Alkalicoccobacillus porphyridii TaxID=2597270 RepID=A0A554A4C4_9BACI|nr:hypothetical protein [Alkalicoccobacillus porphyridii]TSB48538.1 hypothetical protein FN960_03010 [Alkalicoccobacillus porphyridii]